MLERQLISSWLKEGLSKKECSRRLGRHASTIGRELKRNKTRVSVGKEWETIYEPLHAQEITEKRKQNAFNAKQPLKSKKIYTYVLDHLRQSWSPEQISGRLKFVDFPDDPSWHICHETIYQFIYKEKTDQTKKGQLSEIDRRKKKDKLAWIYIKNRKILSTRSKGKNVWYIPGGKREKGESGKEALIREVKEELT